MNLLRRGGTLALAFLMLLQLAACQLPGKEEDPKSMAELENLASFTEPYPYLTQMPGDTVLATVGDMEITVDEVLYHATYMVDSYLEYYSYYGLTEMPWDTQMEEGGKTLEESILEDALQTACLYAMLPLLAREEGLSADQAAVDEILSGLTAMEARVGGPRALEYALWQEPLTEALYRKLINAGVLYGQLQDKLYGENGEVSFTQEDILRYIEDELGYYKAKHILLKTVDTDSPRDANGNFVPLEETVVAEKQALAQEILDQLQAAEDLEPLFDQLMQEHSEDSPAGFEGYVATPGQMVPSFEEGAKALEYGQISGLVDSEFGIHIILRLPLDMDEAYKNEYIAGQMAKLQQQWLDQSPATKTSGYALVDLEDVYTRLGELRTALAAELKAMEPKEETADPAASSSAP